MIPGITPPIQRAREGQAKVMFLGAVESATTTASVSFGDVTLPTSGLVVVTCVGRQTASRTIANISIGGSTGTVHLASAASTNPTAIASRVVTTAGAQNVTVVFNTTSGTSSTFQIGAWLVTDYQSTAPTGTDDQALTASTVISTTFPVTGGGVGVWGIRNLTTTGNTFSGKDTNINSNTTSGALRFTFASAHFFATASSHVESVSNSTSASRTGVGGAWR